MLGVECRVAPMQNGVQEGRCLIQGRQRCPKGCCATPWPGLVSMNCSQRHYEMDAYNVCYAMYMFMMYTQCLVTTAVSS